MTYIGVDPGITGALAVFNDERRFVDFFDCPSYEEKTKTGIRRRMNVPACHKLIREIKGQWIERLDESLLTIEKVHAMVKNGSVPSFGLGYNYGVWVGLIESSGIPYRFVSPQAWKKLMMPGEAKDKDSSRIVACRTFPCAAKDMNLKKHHGRADALLIGEYGRRTS